MSYCIFSTHFMENVILPPAIVFPLPMPHGTTILHSLWTCRCDNSCKVYLSRGSTPTTSHTSTKLAGFLKNVIYRWKELILLDDRSVLQEELFHLKKCSSIPYLMDVLPSHKGRCAQITINTGLTALRANYIL